MTEQVPLKSLKALFPYIRLDCLFLYSTLPKNHFGLNRRVHLSGLLSVGAWIRGRIRGESTHNCSSGPLVLCHMFQNVHRYMSCYSCTKHVKQRYVPERPCSIRPATPKPWTPLSRRSKQHGRRERELSPKLKTADSSAKCKSCWQILTTPRKLCVHISRIYWHV